MLKNLYKKFQNWGSKGAIWVISDTHFEDKDCRLMDKNWLLPEEHIKLLKKYIHKNEYFHPFRRCRKFRIHKADSWI